MKEQKWNELLIRILEYHFKNQINDAIVKAMELFQYAGAIKSRMKSKSFLYKEEVWFCLIKQISWIFQK